MTILTKLSALLNSAIELPNALYAVTEAAREMGASRTIVAKHDDAQICGKLAARIVELEREKAADVSRITSEASELARAIEAERRQLAAANREVEILKCELNREREARRWRKQSEEQAPFEKNVVEKYRDGSVSICSGQLVYATSEWRYLSPEDMQQ